jgi:cytochrome c553
MVELLNTPNAMTLFARLLLSVALAASFSLVHAEGAAPAAPKADPAKGAAVYNGMCSSCHGADGNSGAPLYPKLSQQHPEYLAKQLAEFKSGKRANAIMSGLAAGLSDDDMRNVAAYYASQAAKPGAAKNKDTLELGQKLWRGGDTARGLPACAGCHGATGAGLPSQYPRLAGQHAEYIETQLKGFRAGERQNDPQRMMRMVAAKLTDKDISAVADYIAGLK